MFIDSAKRGWLHHISELLTCQVKQRLPAKELLHKGVLLMLGYFQETTAYQCDCGLVCGMMRESPRTNLRPHAAKMSPLYEHAVNNYY